MAADIIIDKIQFKRGIKANMPILDDGEPFLCTDGENAGEMWIGTKTGANKVINDLAEFRQLVVDYNQTKTDTETAIANANTAATNADTKATELEQRVEASIATTTNSAEIIDARGGFPLLKDHLDDVNAQLAQTESQVGNLLKNKVNVLNVLEYGIVKNNPTLNQTSTMNTIINYAVLNNIGVIYIPAGEYTFTMDFTMGVNFQYADLPKIGESKVVGIQVVGDGKRTVIHNPIGSHAVIIKGDTSNNAYRCRQVNFSNLMFSGSDNNYNVCFDIYWTQHCNFENLYIYNFYGGAFRLHAVYDSDFYYIFSLNCGISDATHNVAAYIFRNMGLWGSSCNALHFFGCHTEHTNSMILSDLAYSSGAPIRHLYFTNCKFEKSKKNTVGSAFDFSGCQEIGFSDCMFANHETNYTESTPITYDDGRYFMTSGTTSPYQHIALNNCAFTTPNNGFSNWITGSNFHLNLCKFIGSDHNSTYTPFKLGSYNYFKGVELQVDLGNKLLYLDGTQNDIDLKVNFSMNPLTTDLLMLYSQGINKIEVQGNLDVPDAWINTNAVTDVNGVRSFGDAVLKYRSTVKPLQDARLQSTVNRIRGKFGSEIAYMTDTGATINQIMDLSNGQIFRVIATNSFTVTNANNIVLKDGATTKTVPVGGIISFLFNNGKAYEI